MIHIRYATITVHCGENILREIDMAIGSYVDLEYTYICDFLYEMRIKAKDALIKSKNRNKDSKAHIGTCFTMICPYIIKKSAIETMFRLGSTMSDLYLTFENIANLPDRIFV